MKQFNLHKIEENVQTFWDKEKIPAKSITQNEGKERFRFIDGPPYTTGKIHLGTAWNKVLKDSILRYKHMQGYDVRSQPGYDMHGLPIEVQVEKELKIKNKQEILDKLGMDKFIKACRKYALDHLTPMSEAFQKLGVWMTWDNPYMTINNSYIEGAWWALKEAHKKKLLYEGPKAVTWCGRCATALAKHELDYQTVKDNSVFVKYALEGKEKEFVLIWTTTPWTLPSNLMVAVHPDLDYMRVQVEDEVWIMAKGLLHALMGVVDKKYDILEEFKGKKLHGTKYVHPFLEEVPVQKERAKVQHAHTIVAVGDDIYHDFVNLSAGTGCVHMAPGAGTEDFTVAQHFGVEPLVLIDENGVFTEEAGTFKGLKAKKDDEVIIDNLKSKEALVLESEVEHEYPHCWRCKKAVLYRATPQWYLATSTLKEKMIAENKKVQWTPDWAGERWFRDWLENLQDWCISRQRFWGIPLPIWRCISCEEVQVVGSRSELPPMDDLHRPWIDKVELDCTCGKKMKRVEDVMDVWLDSGAAPWATLPFPENKKELDKWFPTDFIIEGKDQIRGWFNSLMALSMVSHGKAPYTRIYMHGFVSDNKGQKMSKSIGNVVAPEEAMEKVGADGWRMYSIGGANAGEDLRFNWNDLGEAYKALNTLWNTTVFLEYMGDFNPEEYKLDTKKLKPEDAWILSRVNTLNEQVTHHFENYNVEKVPELLRGFLVDDLSRWYIKLVRDRTWVSVEGEDKLVAFKVLYECLKRFLYVASPIMPHLTEQVYQDVVRPRLKKAPESVHFLSWPEPEKKFIKPDVEEAMLVARGAVEAARFAREDAKVKARWPLAELAIEGEEGVKKAVELFGDVIAAQANVKKVKAGKGKGAEKEFTHGMIYLDTKMTDALRGEALLREVMRAVQVLRKKEGLAVEDKIKLTVSGDEFTQNAVNQFREELVQKVGAAEITVQADAGKGKSTSDLDFDNRKIQVSFDKV